MSDDLIERVAEAIWNAQHDTEWERETPAWKELHDKSDRTLKRQIRAMAKAAIETINNFQREDKA